MYKLDNYGVQTITVDTEQEKESINVSLFPMTTKLYVIESKKWYILDGSKEWQEYPFGSNGSGGNGATAGEPFIVAIDHYGTKTAENELGWGFDKTFEEIQEAFAAGKQIWIKQCAMMISPFLIYSGDTLETINVRWYESMLDYTQQDHTRIIYYTLSCSKPSNSDAVFTSYKREVLTIPTPEAADEGKILTAQAGAITNTYVYKLEDNPSLVLQYDSNHGRMPDTYTNIRAAFKAGRHIILDYSDYADTVISFKDDTVNGTGGDIFTMRGNEDSPYYAVAKYHAATDNNYPTL